MLRRKETEEQGVGRKKGREDERRNRRGGKGGRKVEGRGGGERRRGRQALRSCRNDEHFSELDGCVFKQECVARKLRK